MAQHDSQNRAFPVIDGILVPERDVEGFAFMNVSLTPELEKFVEKKVQTGRYQSASEVIRAGLRLLEERDEERQRGFTVSSVEELETKLIEGLDSGSAGKMPEKDWKNLRRRLEAHLEKKK